MIESLTAQVADGATLAPLLAFAIGALLSLSPIALPSVPAVVSVLAPGHFDAEGERQTLPLTKAIPVIVAFVVGMDGVIGLLGYVFVEVTTFFARAAIVLHVLAATLLGGLGLRLLLRRATLCDRARSIPPRPLPALAYGVVFAVTGCPACGPIAIGIGAAAAIVAGPLYALVILGAFVAGRAAVLVATAVIGARLLPTGTAAVPWRRLDVVVGVLFLAAAAYYVFRIVSGDVTTKLPGEPGSGLLP